MDWKWIDVVDDDCCYNPVDGGSGGILELVSKELNHFVVIAGLFRQIGGHSTLRFLLYVLVLLYVLFKNVCSNVPYTYRTIAFFYFLLHEKSKI